MSALIPGEKLACRLPRKLSDAIFAACRDLTAVERSKKYTVDMSTYYAVSLNDGSHLAPGCAVCFAGALIAKTGGLGYDSSDRQCELLLDAVAPKLVALNAIRLGLVRDALRDWPSRNVVVRKAVAVALVELPPVVPVTRYSPETSKQFKADMRRIARTLARRGL